MAMLVFAGATAVAEVPSAPSDIYASCGPDGQGNRVVDVVWMASLNQESNSQADGYYLYQSINNSSFQRVATVEADQEKWGGYTQVQVGELGTYTFYATAYNEDGESEASYEASVTVPEAWIEFQGEQPVFAAAEIGVEFTHTFTATASNGGEVRFAAGPGTNHWGVEVPCTIDAVTGEFKATVTEDGYYTFPIIAYLADDSTVYAMTTVDLKVGDEATGPRDPQICATISGSVVDVDGNVVNRGFISAFPADQTNWFSTGAMIVDGRYEMPVPEGDYYVVYQSERGEFFQFYPQASTQEEATAVSVACNETATANFELLEALGTEVTITVSGRVTRESDGSGVMSFVTFFDNNGGCGGNVLSTSTDEEGNYEITLPVQYGPWTYSYIGMAMPVKDQDLMYEYFKETPNPEEALLISESSNEVNFTLSGLPVFDASISGMVTDADNNPVESTVLVFSDATPGAFFPMFGVVETNNGAYMLQNLAAGNYYLVVLPHDAHMPGYYAGIAQTVTMNWDEAQTVTLTEGSSLSGVDMIVPTVDAEGINVVDGQVTQKSGSIGKGDDVMGAEPLNGAMLYAIDENGKVVGSAVSGQNGKFQLTGLGMGTYRVYADKLGFLSYESTVTFDKAGDKHTVDVTLQPSATTGVTDPVLDNVGFSTFPNPVTSQLSVRFNSLANTVRVSVSDITGKELISRDVQTVRGENTVQLDLGTLSAGAYIVTLKADNSVLTAPVTVVR